MLPELPFLTDPPHALRRTESSPSRMAKARELEASGPSAGTQCLGALEPESVADLEVALLLPEHRRNRCAPGCGLFEARAFLLNQPDHVGSRAVPASCGVDECLTEAEGLDRLCLRGGQKSLKI